jgi:ligand-binding SRPBCC domain-containing protein
MMTFEHSSFIAAPVEEVFAFHERPDAIELLTPPDKKIEVVRREGGLESGAVVEFRIPAGPLTLRWLAHHIAYEKNRLFIDEQRKGPFTAWVHAHKFKPEGCGTRLIDSIEFSLPGGLISEKLFGWAVRRELLKMFEYRHAVTKAWCECKGGDCEG